MYNYVVWSREYRINDYCQLSHIISIDTNENLLSLRYGLYIENWSENAIFAIDSDSPRVVLADNIGVTHSSSYIIVSKQLKQFIESKKLKNVQYLPISIEDHKKRIISDYFIVHTYTIVDCIDLEKSDVTWNPLDKESIAGARKIVINEVEIDKKLSIFRLKYFKNNILITRELANQILAEKFIGTGFEEIEDLR